MIEVKVTFDPQTKQVGISVPKDNILALGLIAMAQSYVNTRIDWGEGREGNNLIIPKMLIPKDLKS